MGLFAEVNSRLFARFYDAFLSVSERAGLAEIRRRVVSPARGTVLELGAGTGLNLPYYGEDVEELIVTEPSPHLVRRIEDKLAHGGAVLRRPPDRIEPADAQQLPYGDGSFDTVVETMALCTVPDPSRALAEVGRVLKPGGSLLFLEHVRSPDPGLAGWQDRLHGPWYVFGNGCHCNRDTLATIEASPLKLEALERGDTPRSVPLVRPLIWGRAVKPGS